MKSLFLVFTLLFAGVASAANLNPNDKIIVCVKKRKGYSPNSYSLMKLNQPANHVYFENSSGGREIDPIVAKSVVGTKLIVQVQLGTLETITFDLRQGVATWVEDAYPKNTELYPFCRSFANDDFDTNQRWFRSLQQSQVWANSRP